MTYVLGGLQQVTTTAVTGQAPSTSTRSYYTLPGGVLATRKDNDNLIEQATDLLGTPIAALNAKTGLVGEQLRAPYGQPRYNAEASTTGGMHTALGFTGQWEDTQAPGASGMDYFNARYYDPSVGRFLAADPAQPGLGDPSAMDGYGYVGGMVETATDPSGHKGIALDWGGGGAGFGAILFAAIVWATTRAAAQASSMGSPPPINIDLGSGSTSSGTTVSGAASNTIEQIQPQDRTVNLPGGATEKVELSPYEDISVTITSRSGLSSSYSYLPGYPDYVTYMHLFDSEADPAASRTGHETIAEATAKEAVVTKHSHGQGGGNNGGGTGGGDPGGSGLGGSGTNPLADTVWKDQVQNKYYRAGIRADFFHQFPPEVDNFGGDGVVDYPPQADGQVRMRVRIYGSYHGKFKALETGKLGETTWYDGYFEYYVEPDGVTINHRFFQDEP